LTTDEQRERARSLGMRAAAAGINETDNPYTNALSGLAELWASGYSSYTGAVQVLLVEEQRMREAA
jgi:hypothetical protein